LEAGNGDAVELGAELAPGVAVAGAPTLAGERRGAVLGADNGACGRGPVTSFDCDGDGSRVPLLQLASMTEDTATKTARRTLRIEAWFCPA